MDTTPFALETDTETSPLPDDGLNPRQRKFADLYLEGHFGNRAAILAGYSAENASRIATRLLRNPAIAAYLSSERDRLSCEHFYNRRLLIDWLWKAVHSSIDEIEKGDNLIQEQITRQDTKGNHTHRIKLVNKLAAFRQLARMLGFDKPELTLPGKLAGAFQAFLPAHSGVVSSPRHHSPGVPLPAKDRSPLPGKDRSPSGPVGAAPTTPDAQGPDNRPPHHPTQSPTAPVSQPHSSHPDPAPTLPQNPGTTQNTPNPAPTPPITALTTSLPAPYPIQTSSTPPSPTLQKLDISGHLPALTSPSKTRKPRRSRKKKAKKNRSKASRTGTTSNTPPQH